MYGLSKLKYFNFISGVCTAANEVKSCIVLAGDPKQLDAVTKSKRAEALGHNTSLMEHLLKKQIYKKNMKTRKFNQNYVTQLVENYRNHPAILKIPNDLFYESTLKASASKGVLIFKYRSSRMHKNY